MSEQRTRVLRLRWRNEHLVTGRYTALHVRIFSWRFTVSLDREASGG